MAFGQFIPPLPMDCHFSLLLWKVINKHTGASEGIFLKYAQFSKSTLSRLLEGFHTVPGTQFELFLVSVVRRHLPWMQSRCPRVLRNQGNTVLWFETLFESRLSLVYTGNGTLFSYRSFSFPSTPLLFFVLFCAHVRSCVRVATPIFNTTWLLWTLLVSMGQGKYPPFSPICKQTLNKQQDSVFVKTRQ